MKIKWGRLIGLVFIGICLVIDPATAAQKKGAAKTATAPKKTNLPAKTAAAPQKTSPPSMAPSVDVALVFGKTGTDPGEFGTIDGVWVDARGRILVVDKGNQRINFFNGGGRFLKSFGEPGEGPGQFKQCTGIVIDRQQRIIVSDQNNFRLQVFDAEGKFLTAFGRKGTGDGEFLEPMGLALDSRGHLYVSDGTRDDIQVFDENFAFIRKFGTLKPEAGRMERIESLAVGPLPREEIFVADEKNSRIHRFSPEGEHLGTFGKQGSGPGMFAKEVEGLAFDDLGYLYAVDETAGKIEVFTPEGRPVHSFGGGLGIRPGQFNSPDGLHYSPLYHSMLVADQKNHRVQVFHLEDIWKNKKRVSQKPDHQQTGHSAGDGRL
ncbi:MAG: NHL repeat-containing protein [Deltaproteobacteria bacterium]|nr:NHL repeat-containing protein [Deltaproteobacteria bacterium]